MRSFSKLILLPFIIFVSFNSAVQANVSVAGRVGLMGVGADLSYAINDTWAVRLNLNSFGYDYDAVEDGIDYELELGLQTVGALVDWRPFQGEFRVSFGYMSSDNKISGVAASADNATYEVGGTTYTAADLESLLLDVDLGSAAPYVGIGWGMSPGSGWGLVLDVGVFFQGKPTVSLTATGTLATDQAFLDDALEEVSSLEGDFEDFEMYPVVSLGVSYAL